MISLVRVGEETLVARWALTNGNGYDVFPTSEDDLVRHLREIDDLARRDGRPRVAVLTPDIEATNVPYLSIAVGAEDSVLVFEQGDDEHGGYSKGSRVEDQTEISFAYGTGVAEYQAWMLSPKDAAFTAATEFYRTGTQPTCVAWGDV